MSLEIRRIEDIDDFTKLTLSEFSYSRIDTYEMCPSKYFFSYIKKEPRQFNGPAILGNIVHEVLENTVSAEDVLDLDEMHNKYIESIDSYDPNKALSEDLLNAGAQIIDEFFDLNKDKTFDVYGKEIGFKFVIGNYSIIGFIDRIDVVDDNVFIVDYKTGKREVAAKDVSSNLQMGIYALAASVMFPGKTITAALHYLRTNRLKAHTYSKEDLEFIKQKLVERIMVIVEDQNFSPTLNERVCSFCDHSQSGACAVGAVRLKKFRKYT
jgi:RecB family exonuclease